MATRYEKGQKGKIRRVRVRSKERGERVCLLLNVRARISEKRGEALPYDGLRLSGGSELQQGISRHLNQRSDIRQYLGEIQLGKGSAGVSLTWTSCECNAIYVSGYIEICLGEGPPDS